MVPISVFLIPYGLFLLLFLFFSFVNIYHLIRFTTHGAIVSFMVTVAYAAITVIILNATYLEIINIDWSRTIQLIPSFGPPSF